MFADPLAQELFIGATIGTAFIMLGMALGYALAVDRRHRESEDR